MVILTSDDPGNEDPQAIAEEISQHITNQTVEQHIIIDRKEAIIQALSMAEPNDTIILAGKGRDLYQKINGVDTSYEGDYTIAEKIISN